MPEPHAVFVYGTLRPDESGAHFWRGAVERLEPGVLPGALLFDLGPYPMAIRGEGQIHGEVLQISPLRWAKTLARFDRYEGVSAFSLDPLYHREVVKVLTASGEVPAWVYFGRQRTARRGRLIESGDWKRRFETQIENGAR